MGQAGWQAQRLRRSRFALEGRPASVYLVAGHNRTFMYGPPAEWALELVPAPSSGRTGLLFPAPSGN